MASTRVILAAQIGAFEERNREIRNKLVEAGIERQVPATMSILLLRRTPTLSKGLRVLRRKAERGIGGIWLEPTLEAMACRPFELHLELTNLCNADCVFCPYHYQEREVVSMPDAVFARAVSDFVSCGGGSVGLTPIVGDALIDKNFVPRVRYLRGQKRIDRIWVTTNGILLDKHGIEEILTSGLSAITISTAGFDASMYRRVYRSASYNRMRRNVRDLLRANAQLADPIPITVSLRPDRSIKDVMRDPDFQEILELEPLLDFTWSYTTANGRISEDVLPSKMRVRRAGRKHESCAELFSGPIVLGDGDVLGCSCVAAMDALEDLKIGNIFENSLSEIWTGERMAILRRSFLSTGQLNKTCRGCDMYRDLELYRTREGRFRAALNRRRAAGETVRRGDRPSGFFSGG